MGKEKWMTFFTKKMDTWQRTDMEFPSSKNHSVTVSNRPFITLVVPSLNPQVYHTWLIFCQSLSSFAFSSLGPARRVLRPSDILIPNWKAALERENKTIVTFWFCTSHCQVSGQLLWEIYTTISINENNKVGVRPTCSHVE